jgi:beta-lactamase class A
MAPASMIKLFVMAKTMQDVHDGKLSLDEKITIKKNDAVGGAGVTTWYNAGEQRTVEQLMTVMITDSDNTATNILIDRLGMQNINRYLQQQGFRDTALVYKMMMGRKGKKKNLSSVRDIGSLFSRLYYHQLVGEQEDKLMLAILRQQHDKECFPAVLPAYEIAHKTGEVNDVYVDGGIFFGQKEDFVLVVLSNGKAGRGDAIERMQNLAKYYAGTLQE